MRARFTILSSSSQNGLEIDRLLAADGVAPVAGGGVLVKAIAEASERANATGRHVLQYACRSRAAIHPAVIVN